MLSVWVAVRRQVGDQRRARRTTGGAGLLPLNGPAVDGDEDRLDAGRRVGGDGVPRCSVLPRAAARTAVGRVGTTGERRVLRVRRFSEPKRESEAADQR